jgi:hypothetical protein
MQTELIEDDEQILGVLGELAVVATTSRIIHWNAFREWLEVAPAPLTDRERIELLIRIANEESVTGAQLNALVGAQVVGGADQRRVPIPELARNWIRAGLLTALRDPRRAFTESKRLSEASVVVVPTNHHGEQKARIIAENVQAAVAHTIILLTDKKSPLAGQLLQCPYTRCHRFFLRHPRTKSGRPLLACRLEHGRLADNERAAERMRRR